jgi:phage terminase small subunit
LTISPTTGGIKPPSHLRPATREWFANVVGDYDLEEHHLRLLTLAGEAWDRGQQAREVLDRDGLTYLDRFGAPRVRPEVSIERDSRIAFARLLREMSLDVETPPEPSRPPALRH